MRRSRTTHAGVASTEKQDRVVRLIAQGVNNSEACRQVGINRRTGTRWRFGRTVQNTAGVNVHYAPARSVTPSTRHPRYLSLDERTVIADLRRARWTLRDIADELGRSPSTISRELRRTPTTAAGICLPPLTKPPSSGSLGRGPGGWPPTPSCRRSWLSCWTSDGARSRSRTSCLSGSPAGLTGSCAPSRSIRRSTTRPCRSPARRSDVGAAAGGGCRASSGAVG